MKGEKFGVLENAVFLKKSSLQECLASLSYVNDVSTLRCLVERLLRIILPDLVSEITSLCICVLHHKVLN